MIALSKHNPAHIYFIGRNRRSAETVLDQVKATNPNINASFIECDLASLSSVEKAAKLFTAESQRLDILMCNAGAMALPLGLSKDGYEIQFGTNHLGHALLIKLLLPILLKTAEQPNSDVRIIILSSEAHKTHPTNGIKFDMLKTEASFAFLGPWKRYGQSKLANILYASELARRYPSIITVSVHPGSVNTGLSNHGTSLAKTLFYLFTIFRLKEAPEGSWNQLWAATADKKKITSGEYYVPVAVVGSRHEAAKNKQLAEELWKWTEKELENYHA